MGAQADRPAATSVASVLLGAGCRGIDAGAAARVAAAACVAWGQELEDKHGDAAVQDADVAQLHFILREERLCALLVECLEDVR